MAKAQWFRRTTWDGDDQREFYARLRRSRSSFHKAQYLRIQALHLERDAEPPLLDAALQLLSQLLAEYPHASVMASAFHQRASCLRRLGQHDRSLDAIQSAIEAEHLYPHTRTTAYLDYAELVLHQNRRDLYEAALQHLGQRSDTEPFPMLRYRSRVAMAMLYERLGRTSEARDAAKSALAAAAATESPFRYHRKLGLVKSTDVGVQEWLWRLTGIAG